MKKQSIEHTQLLVLSLLASRDMYGYEMIVELARRSQNVFEMKEGTLYPVLYAMEKAGTVAAYEQTAPTGRTRKYYRLTQKGRGCLADEKAAWARYADAVNAVLRTEALS